MMDTLCVLAATDSMHSEKKKICLEWSKMNRSRVMWSGYIRFRGVSGVGSFVSNKWWHVEIGRWIEYACSVKSETINLDRRVNKRCSCILFLSEDILGYMLLVILEYASRVLGYNTSTRHRLDSLSIPGSSEIYCAGSVSGKSRSW